MKAMIKQLTKLDEIYKTILYFDSDFVPSLTERGLNLKDYARKLYEYAYVYTLNEKDTETAFVAFYANDFVHHTAYLAQIAVKPQFCNQGYGYALLKLAMEIAKEKNMNLMKLEVCNQNQTAIEFYKRQGFIYYCDTSDTFCYMQKELV